MRIRRSTLAGVAVAVLAGALVAPDAQASSGSALDRRFAERQSHLPRDLGLGVKAALTGNGSATWMRQSRVPWQFANQYLVGLGSSANWTTWQPQATYPIDYARSAAAARAIPVFTYFQINHAAACAGCSNIQRNLRNLASPMVMSSWFSDFRTLLQRLSSGRYGGVAGYGRTTIVHVEPDLSAYVQQALIHPAECPGTCRPRGSSPNDVSAAVSATGIADLAGFANTYAGFNQAVLALRDKYAPNVLLAYHVSNWAGRADVGLSRAKLDERALADQVAGFAKAAGAARLSGKRHYDLLFNDVLDRDAGSRRNGTLWWDADNAVQPTFHRWESFLSRIVAQLHLPAVVWQVPIGNQYFLTSDGSRGHTQDNRVQYFFDHAAELRDIGVWAVLFGAGSPGTAQWDALGDGVTNAAGRLCSSYGHSRGPVCWSHRSTVSDDDGGYLRIRGAGYYAHGPLPVRAP